jgi:hypothetical protein
MQTALGRVRDGPRIVATEARERVAITFAKRVVTDEP